MTNEIRFTKYNVVGIYEQYHREQSRPIQTVNYNTFSMTDPTELSQYNIRNKKKK